MLNEQFKNKIKEYWGQNVVFAFKEGLWELQQTERDTWVLRRFKGKKSKEVTGEVQIKATNINELAACLSNARWSGKEKRIIL